MASCPRSGTFETWGIGLRLDTGCEPVLLGTNGEMRDCGDEESLLTSTSWDSLFQTTCTNKIDWCHAVDQKRTEELFSKISSNLTGLFHHKMNCRHKTWLENVRFVKTFQTCCSLLETANDFCREISQKNNPLYLNKAISLLIFPITFENGGFYKLFNIFFPRFGIISRGRHSAGIDLRSYPQKVLGVLLVYFFQLNLEATWVKWINLAPAATC